MFDFMHFGVCDSQMALIARIQHPNIVEFKEAWVEKVRSLIFSIFAKFNLTRLLFYPEL